MLSPPDSYRGVRLVSIAVTFSTPPACHAAVDPSRSPPTTRRSSPACSRRLHLVAVWREAPFLTPRERAALAWTEALTLLPETGAPDDVYEAMAREFDPAERVALSLAIVAINGWNRLAVGFRRPVGSYVSHRHPEPAAGR